MRLPAREVARVVGGTLQGPDVDVDGAGIDSRVLRPGQLFVPVVAARDGHDFIDHALVAGAAAYLTARPPQGGTAVVVEDTVAALTALGRWARDQLSGQLVVTRHGRTLVERAWGKANAELNVPVTLETRFNIASVTKPMTATVAIQLAVETADAGDVVVIAGKGHEQGQEFAGGRKEPFDDVTVAREALHQALGAAS